MKKLLALLFVSALALVVYAGTLGQYHLVQAIPDTFPLYSGFLRELYQDHVLVRVAPGRPAPTGFVFTGSAGQTVTVPITTATQLTAGWWQVSTPHQWEVGFANGVGSVRLVEPSNALSVGFVP